MSKREDLELRIKEQRVLEANKKGLMGASGKIGTTLRMLGSDIIYHGEDYGVSFLHSDEDKEEPKNAKEMLSYMPTMDAESNERPTGEEWSEIGEIRNVTTRKIGMHFDGLSRGMHMEIKYNEEKSELSVTHKGYLVYKEVMGDLEVYVPGEWEGWVERLWSLSREKQRKQKEEEFKEKAEKANEAKSDWLEYLIRRWGRI